MSETFYRLLFIFIDVGCLHRLGHWSEPHWQCIWYNEGLLYTCWCTEEFLGFYRQYHVETETHENIIVRTDRGVKKEVGKEIQLQVK